MFPNMHPFHNLKIPKATDVSVQWNLITGCKDFFFKALRRAYAKKRARWKKKRRFSVKKALTTDFFLTAATAICYNLQVSAGEKSGPYQPTIIIPPRPKVHHRSLTKRPPSREVTRVVLKTFSIITPIHKGGSKLLAKQYRPVALLILWKYLRK